MVINTNITAQSSATQLEASSQRLSQSLARLSSGSKITSPADDSAGLAVSMKLGAQISRNSAAQSNVANATSFSQTQDGYLQQVGTALNRMSELTIAAQDVTKTTTDRQLYNQEFQSLASYVNDVATKDFNGVSLFSGNALNVTTDSEGGTFAMTGISGSILPATTTTTSTSPVGDAASTQLGSISPNFNSDSISISSHGGSADYSKVFNSTDTVQDFVNYVNTSNGEASATYDSSSGNLSLTLSPSGRIYTPQIELGLLDDLGFTSSPGWAVNQGSTPETLVKSLTHNVTTTTTTSALDLTSVTGAKAAMTAITAAVAQVASERATVGSNEERLSYTSRQLTALNNNLAAASSNITDVDVAQESTNYAKENILVQSGTAMLAQANSLPQSVLKLLG